MDAGRSSEEMEQRIHHQIIEDISIGYHLPLEQVISAYERELALLGAAASVRSYLPILVKRRMKILLTR